MDKIGIITYHYAYNYGALLQAYALQTKLDMLGYEAEIINFRPSAIVDDYQESRISGENRAKLYRIIKRNRTHQGLIHIAVMDPQTRLIPLHLLG